MPLKETSPNTIPHPNLMHVKFHANKHQENLLSKRLQQLNSDEMKYRLKHQRTSDELIIFLRDCQKTTGYFAKMKSFQSNSVFIGKNGSKKSKFESKSSLDMTNNSKVCSISQIQTSNGSKAKKFPMKENSSKSRIDLAYVQNRQKALFERILNSPGSSANSSSSRSNVTSKSSCSESKQEMSDRSATSLYSNSIDFNEIFKETDKKVRPITSQIDSRPNRPNNTFEYNSTKSHLDWTNNIKLDLDNESRKSSSSYCSAKSSVTSFKKSEFMAHRPKYSEKMPTNTVKTSINPPIRINMSRSSLKKKQLEIMNEYSRATTLELLENFRKIQQDLTVAFLMAVKMSNLVSPPKGSTDSNTLPNNLQLVRFDIFSCSFNCSAVCCCEFCNYLQQERENLNNKKRIK
ncbi:hypothetical protein BpHYR1_050912 [Brachionus plicatilis]|uniref:Uncharacterized protein n=1 Tax=Brachionus plicatilis TaxID=10195 RepID=A0A3M7RJB3_BRAPC|nr:hypothetical protein BpHYR1_050912 [Brachionus plicatilis]